jgi:Mpv17 / PMP22 family
VLAYLVIACILRGRTLLSSDRCSAEEAGTHCTCHRVQDKFVPTMAASYKLWPAAHLVNFALVPPAYRVLYTNLVSVRIHLLSPYADTRRCVCH